MAVQVADTLKAKNNLDFPVVESQDIKGGLHCVSSIEEITTLLASSKVMPGMLVYVSGTADVPGKTYQVNDDMLGYHEFNGELSNTQMESIVEYVQQNLEHSELTEENGVTYLTLY